jgi:hypothetical protein
MMLSRRIALERVGPTPTAGAEFLLADEITGRQAVIPAGAVAKLLGVARGFLTDAAPDGLDVLAFEPDAGEPGFRTEARAVPTGRSIELPHVTATRLVAVLAGEFRPYWDGV